MINRKGRENFKCIECEKVFSAVVSAKRKFCSRVCMWSSNKWLGKKNGFFVGHPNYLTEESKKKIGNSNKGLCRTEETRRKMSISKSGANNHRWNPNREEVKKNLRNDGIYQQWVRDIKKRDDYTCRINNKDCSGHCIVHHILSWSRYPELRYEINNGITLCLAHHPRKRAEEKRLVPFFNELISVSKV